MSDPFDRDPDDLLEPDDAGGDLGEQLEPDDPGAAYEEGRFDTAPAPPEAPSPSSPSEIDYDQIDPELRKIFWKLVLVVKFTLIALTLGVLFVTLGDRTTLGWQLLAFSAVLIGYGAYQYRESKQRIESEEFEATNDAAESNDDETKDRDGTEESGSSDRQPSPSTTSGDS